MAEEYTPDYSLTVPEELTREKHKSALNRIDGRLVGRGPIADRPTDLSDGAIWLVTEGDGTIEDNTFTRYDDTIGEWVTAGADLQHTDASHCEIKVFESDGEAIALDSDGVIDSGTDHRVVIQAAIDSMSAGDSILCKGHFIIDSTLNYGADDSAFYQEGSFTLDDGGEMHDGHLINFYGKRMKIYNLTVDQDRENNIVSESRGAQPAVLFGGSASEIRVFGPTVKNTIHAGMVIDGNTNIQVFGAYLENIGEHAFYCANAEGIDLIAPRTWNAAENISSDGYKFRNCENVNVKSGFIHFDENVSNPTRGVRVEYGSRNVDVELTVENAEQGFRVSNPTDGSSEKNQDVTARMSVDNCDYPIWLAGGDPISDESVSVERMYVSNSEFRTEGLQNIGKVIVADGSVATLTDDSKIDELVALDAITTNVVLVQSGANVEIGKLSAENIQESADEWESAVRVRDTGHLTVHRGTVRAPQGGAGIFIEDDATANINNVRIEESSGTPSHLIRQDSTGLCVLDNVTSEDALPDVTLSEVGGSLTLINGAGRNSGDPSAEGAWNGNGREGATIRDSSADDLHTFIDGGWRGPY